MSLSTLPNKYKVSLFFASFFLILGGLSLRPGRAHAFEAGRIMDDAVFYAGHRMDEGSIQHFLNVKVPSCDTNGSKPYGGTTRAAYGSSRGYPPPYVCLKDKVASVMAKAPDSLCNGLGGGTKTAARIIDEVSKSCGVNPQVLLVLLQKEQSLVTDDWPWTIQYDKATGYACPDSAPCNPEYAGFSNQVYEAARAFKRYRSNPNNYNYRPQRNNNILFHPNGACGSSTVFIHNQATAGLYIYTPYQPNQALLSGSPNGCSSYGNYNFWNYFLNWFGNPHTTVPFDWWIESQEIYRDQARTQRAGNLTVAPGEKLYVRVTGRNVGYTIWGNTYVRMGTSRPNDRVSQFQDTTWLNHARATQIKEAEVQPGGIGTFEFVLKAPNTPGSYREYFNVVADKYTWMSDPGMQFPIDVVQSVAPSNFTNVSLASGQQLLPGQRLLSPDRHSVLMLQGDGNLVLYSNFRPVWASGTSGRLVTRLVMQTDGNLVLYNGTQPLWATGTDGNPGAWFALQTDGNLVTYSASSSPLWASHTVHVPDHLSYVNKFLPYGTTLFPNQQIETANRKYRAILQSDGNFVVYSPNRAIWATGTDGKTVTRVIMQPDGNLVLYNGTQPVWNSHTAGRGISDLHMQPDGNVVIYDARGLPTWHTQTAGVE